MLIEKYGEQKSEKLVTLFRTAGAVLLLASLLKLLLTILGV